MPYTMKRILLMAVALLLSACQPVKVYDDNGLTLNVLCEGEHATVYGQELTERLDCGKPNPLMQMPKARLEDAPRFASPYTLCTQNLVDMSAAQRMECAETSFWHAYSDGRLAVRNQTLDYLSKVINLAESATTKTAEEQTNLIRLYQLRGMFYMAMGIENGQWQYLALSFLFSGRDFANVARIDPHNFAASSFNDTLNMTNARIIGGHALSAKIAKDALNTARYAGDATQIEPINVGSMLALTGVTMHYPLNTGLPKLSLDMQLAVGCIDSVDFCVGNTLHAPFARPGLEYHLAEMYARLNMKEAYVSQLKTVSEQAGYDEWAWKGLVEMQMENPDVLLNKFKSFGDDEYSDGYATRNMGCVMCHGRI